MQEESSSSSNDSTAMQKDFSSSANDSYDFFKTSKVSSNTSNECPFSHGSECPCSHGSEEHWSSIKIDLDALRNIVCEVFSIPPSQCGSPVLIGNANFARIYSFQLPTRKVVSRLVYPSKPLFKTENEVAAMDFVRSRTSLPVPEVFSYCSDANNPVGVEWLIMEHMPGITLDEALEDLGFPQLKRLALDIVDLYDQLSRLKADGCGGIYHRVNSVDDCSIPLTSKNSLSEARLYQRSPRWGKASYESLRSLKALCNHSVQDCYNLGPLNDFILVKFNYPVPPPSATLPVFSSDEYVKLLSFKGTPSTRSEYDIPTREKCIELFQNIYKFYPNSTVFGPTADPFNFSFSHGDLHGGNILINPETGAITGIIDWEGAAFRPLWSQLDGIGWFSEDAERHIFGCRGPRNFKDETALDAELRAFFRTELYKRNPDLFSAFLGAIELRAVLHAASDDPRPEGQSNIFLVDYYESGCWKENRRGPFPWDMLAWRHRRVDLDELEMALAKAK